MAANPPEVGKIIDSPFTPPRDAIHVAVLPVKARETVYPGQAVGMYGNGTVGERKEPAIGVVDPFLKKPVDPGTLFYLFLYPNTITSLNHHWEHPEIDKAPVQDKTETQAWSRRWIEEETERCNLNAEEVLDWAGEWVKGGVVSVGFDSPDMSKMDMDKFWQHYEVLTGKKMRNELGTKIQFSCSC